MTREESLLLRRVLAAVGGMAAFFLLARQCGRPWFPVLPAMLSGWTCGAMLQGKAYRRFREPAMAAGFVLPLLAAWAPGALVGATFAGTLLGLVLSEGRRAGQQAARRALGCVLGVSVGCCGISTMEHPAAVLVLCIASWTVFLLFRASTSRKGFAVAMALGWLVGFAVLAAESSEAPGTVDLLFGAVWCVGAAASGWAAPGPGTWSGSPGSGVRIGTWSRSWPRSWRRRGPWRCCPWFPCSSDTRRNPIRIQSGWGFVCNECVVSVIIK